MEGRSVHGVILTKAEEFIDRMETVIKKGMSRLRVDRLADEATRPMFNWAMRNSPFPLHFGIMCCALEFAAAWDPRYDVERFGVVARSSPRQCDLLIVTGPISHKLKPHLRRLYDQMPEPKWVMCMGECSISGGPFYDSYFIVEGTDTFIPVDIYIPGCPPRPEAMLDGIFKLQQLVREQRKGMWGGGIYSGKGG